MSNGIKIFNSYLYFYTECVHMYLVYEPYPGYNNIRGLMFTCLKEISLLIT